MLAIAQAFNGHQPEAETPRLCRSPSVVGRGFRGREVSEGSQPATLLTNLIRICVKLILKVADFIFRLSALLTRLSSCSAEMTSRRLMSSSSLFCKSLLAGRSFSAAASSLLSFVAAAVCRARCFDDS